MSRTTPRVLIALNEPGYFRLYGSTITELAKRGWDVSLVYDKPHRRGPDTQLPADSAAGVRSLGALPSSVSPSTAMRRVGLDYLRYLEPDFAGAAYLRRRAEGRLPASLGWLTRVRRVPRWGVSAAIAVARGIERIQPIAPAMLAFVRDVRPAVILVSPMVIIGRSGVCQTELVRAARALDVPVIVGVASWDHLTSKGLIRVVPDAVTVWNETQVREAVRLHRIPRSRIIVTGAQSLDHWFEPTSGSEVQAFRRTLRIADDRHVILVVGSSPNMAPGESEVMFVRRWLTALRTSATPATRRAYVIVRPHPGNTAPWQNVDFADPDVVICPKAYSGMPLSAEEIATFRHSLAASTAVVGINTTAMIEAAILRKPVFSIRDAAFDHSQAQTLHFSHLVGEEGFVSTALTLPEHIQQLDRLFVHGASTAPADRFVERFIRPLGLNESATARLCDAIERVAHSSPVTPLAAAPVAARRWRPSRAKADRP
jgi:hypothetical protein